MVSNLCPPDFDGGQEVRALQVAEALREAGHSVDLVTSAYRDSFRGTRDDPHWVHRILRYVEKGEQGLAKLLRFLAAQGAGPGNCERLSEWLRDKEFDVAYLFGLHRIGLATHLAFVSRGVPVLWHCGDDFLVKQLVSRPRESAGYRLLLATLLRTSRKMEVAGDYRNLAFNSKWLRDDYASQGMTIQREWIIPRSVDFEPRTDVDRERTRRFLIATRIHEQKGVHVALEAARLVHLESPDKEWCLQVIGKTEHHSYQERLDDLVSKNGLGARVIFVGQLGRNEVLDRIADSIALLQTSIYEEPMGNTIIEALGCGTPVIASDVGAAREMIEDRVSGLIIPANDPRALADAMKKVMDDRTLRENLARQGLRVAQERFSLASVIGRTEEVLQVVARQRGGR